MNQIKHQIKMSSSLSSAVRSSKTSSSVPVPAGQRRFPDGYVGPADMPFCKVCYDAGLPVANYTNHFVKDQPGPDGKVVCPTLLAQKCLKCGLAGHTSSYCAGSRGGVVDSDRTARLREEREQVKKANGGWETVGSDTKSKPKPRIEDLKPKTVAVAVPASAVASSRYGSFGVLAVDESSSSSEDERQEIQKPKIQSTQAPAPAPAPPARDPTKPLSWAQRAAAAASKPTPCSIPAPAPASSKLFSDTRFALHALCENITVSKRAPPRGTSSSSEISKKRKQESVTVPA